MGRPFSAHLHHSGQTWLTDIFKGEASSANAAAVVLCCLWTRLDAEILHYCKNFIQFHEDSPSLTPSAG